MRVFGKKGLKGSAGIFCLLAAFCIPLILPAAQLHAKSPSGDGAAGASSDKWYFSRLSTEDGLPFNNVNAIAQDSLGFIWIATEDGLSRYDGRNFKNFHKEELGTGSDFITALCADSRGNLWVGSDKGASRYDYLRGAFIPIDTPSDKGTVMNGKVTHICLDGNGLVWMSVNGLGLFSFDPAKEELRNYFNENGRTTLPVNIRSFVVDAAGEFWFSLYFADLWHSDSALENIEKVQLPLWEENDDIMSMDRGTVNGKIILSAWKNGLCEYDCRRGSLKKLIGGTSAYRPKGMYFDRDGRKIYVATTRGLCICDLSSGATSRLTPDSRDRFSLSGNNLTAVFADRSGGLWVGVLSGGLNYASEYHKSFRKYYTADGESLAGSFVMDVTEDENGRIWLASENRGLMYKDKGEEAFHRFRSSLLPANTRSLCADGGTLWVGTSSGLFRIDISTGGVRSLGGDIHDNVHRLIRTASGDILAGFPLGIIRYSSSSGKLEHIPSFDGMYVTDMAETYPGELWVSTYANGIVRYSLAEDRILARYGFDEEGSRHIGVDKFVSIREDSKGGIWAGSYGEGLLRYDRASDGFVRFGRDETQRHRIAFSMVEDRNGRMWVASENGLFCFEYPSPIFRDYTAADGLLDDMIEGHNAICTSLDELLFCSNNGAVEFNPDNLSSSDSFPPLVLTDFSIGDAAVTPQSVDSPLRVNINETSEIVLHHSQNTFSVGVSPLGWSSPANTECRYMLEGYDNSWRTLSPDGVISYSNIPAGGYRLLLRSEDGNGQTGGAHAPVNITVKEVFYKTGAAYAVYVLLLIAAVIAIVYFATRSAVDNERKRQEKEKLAREQEVFREKITFFYNIIHEIKTPLTLIRTPLQNIISTGGLSGELAEDLSVIGNNTDYLDKLVRELLDFVRIEENGWVLEYREVDLVGKIDFLCFNFQETARTRNISLTFTHTEPGIMMAADEAALLKILNNLIHNAVKYAETRVVISAGLKNGCARVSVRNDGPAIPPGRREEIFKPFVQYSNDIQPYSQSFGIGLSLARTLAGMHGGSLVLSDNDSLTEFVLTLPLNRDKTTREETSELSPESLPEESSNKPLVLVVEDNADLSAYLSRKLSPSYRVLTASSAEQALSLLERNGDGVDIILSDIALGGMSGIDLCRKVSSDFETSHIPVVILSALSSVKTKITCMESGAALYIEKPFSLDYLLGSLEVISRKRENFKRAHLQGLGVSSDKDFDISTPDGEFLSRLDRLIMENLADPEWGNDALAEQLCLSKSTLIRKTKGLLGATPNDYIRTKRLNIAAAMLSKGNCRINEVCYSVGFNTPSYFAKCFKRQFGVLPADYMKEKSQL